EPLEASVLPLSREFPGHSRCYSSLLGLLEWIVQEFGSPPRGPSGLHRVPIRLRDRVLREPLRPGSGGLIWIDRRLVIGFVGAPQPPQLRRGEGRHLPSEAQ